MKLRSVLTLLLAGLTTACATAMDAMRDGEPVIETTFKAIYDHPDAWEGKWVRISGWVDRNKNYVVSEKGNDNDWWTLYLDPVGKIKGRESEGGIPDRAAVVSGKVDLTCAHFWNDGCRWMAENGIVGSFSAEEPGPLAHCNRARGPNLVNVLVATLPKSAQ
ncbi:MAG: hypothetical protein ABMA14_11685 [Hyphomonadaceae bacterium]